MNRFEEKLRREMLLRGFNQQKLARASGVSDSEVSRVLAGRSQPGLENALRLARAVGASLDYLADDVLDASPTRRGEPVSDEEREVLELARTLGPRSARRVLESASIVGVEIALRRLHGAEPKPIIEVEDGPRTCPARRASSA